MLHLDQYGIPENLNNRRVAHLSGYGQRRPGVIPCLVDVRAYLDQRLHYRLLALLSGYGQRRPSVIRRLVGWLTSAPNSISARTTASWPLLAAM